MLFEETRLKGAFVIHPEKREDSRGFFARACCKHEFEARGLNTHFVQCNISFNKKRWTLRGMHFQKSPKEEAKLVRCTKGSILDVIIDLRPSSATYQEWVGVELTENNHTMLYVPESFAHGYLTLLDESEVFYQVSEFYSPEYESGVRWNDLAFGIRWPEVMELIISEKDENWPDYLP